MKKHLLFILLISTTISLMAIGTGDGSTEVSGCEEATQLYIDGNCWYFNSEGWYKFDLTELQNEEDIRVLLTNSFGIGGETYSISFYESCDATEPLFALNGEMVDESSSVDTVIPKQALDGINELYVYTTYSEGISLNIYPYIPCSRFDMPYYEWGTVKVMDASLTEFENAFYFVDIEGFYATPQRFNVGDLSSNQSVKLTVNNPSISEGVFAFISLNNDCSSQGCFIGRPGSIFAHQIESGQTHSWILDFPYLFEGEQDAYFLPAITTGDGSFISGTWSLEIINAIKTSTCADAIHFQSDVLYEQLGNTNQYYTLNGAFQDDITPLATEVTITNQSENEAEWICSVGYCGVEEIIAIEQLAAGETKTIQLEIPAFDTYYPEGGGNLYANITTTEDISMLFDVVDSDSTLPIVPCLNAIHISLGETVTAPANEESWYILDITEVHEKQQEFRWTFTNLSDKEAEVNLGMFLDCFTEDSVVDFGTRSFAANQIISSAWSYSDLTDIFPDYISDIYIRIIPTEDISLQFAVVDSDTSESEPCLNAIHISLGETVTAPANEESWYVLDITEVHEKQQEFRWTFTNLSDKEVEMNMGMFFSCDSGEVLELNKSFPANRIRSLVWSYPDVTDFFPDYISSIFIRITPTEDMAIRFSLPATCEEEAIELDWCNVHLSQLCTGWYKWNVADIHSNQEDVVFNVTNDMMYPTSVTMDYYITCDDTKPMNDFGGSQTYMLGNNQQIISYQRFVELFATGTDSFGEYYESGFHNDVYIHISSIVQDYEPEPTPETHLIRYTSTDGNIVTPYDTTAFGANIISNTYKDGQGVITFDGPVTNIGQEAFSGSNITSIVIPESVQTIGASAFHSCYELTSISLPENLKNIDFATFAYCKKLPKITIPRNVTSIGPSAFYGCYVLDSLTIPENVTSIGEKAFYSCSSLKTIIWNAYKYENTIEKSPLYDIADALRTIIFGDSMTHIPNHMCYNLKLNKIILPIGLESIGDMAFSGSNITSIVIPESVHTIGASAFHSCYELTSISLPENLKNIDFATFAYCKKLPKITIPRNVTSIGPSAFYGCYVLDSLTIPENVTSIGEQAFYRCSSLTTMYANPIIPPSLGTSAFNGHLNEVYVQCGSANAYKSSSWNTYCTNFIEPEVLYSVSLHSADTTQGQVIFDQDPSCDNTAIIRAIPSSGYRFTTWNDGVTTNPRTLLLSQDTTFTANFELMVLDAEYATICYGESYIWDKNGQTYTESGTYTTITSEGEVTLHLTILPEVPITNTSATICHGETYTWNGQTYSATGEYNITLSNTLGCDSVATLHLTIMPEAVTTTETVVIGSDALPYLWRGNTYSATGQYIVVEQYTTIACDSAIHVLDLTVLTTGNHDEQSVTICETEVPYTWYGESYTATGKYTYTEKYAGTDIDSIQHILNLTVNPTVYTEEHITACDSYEWNGQTYTQSGEYTYTTVAANGCDSIVALHLTISPTLTAEETITACDSYDWNGQTYTQSGDYVYTTTAANGCDSIVTLHLTISPTLTAEETITACDFYDWNGQTYTQSGDYVYTTTAANGCDSIVTLHLTINNTQYAEEFVVVCDSYAWNGETYTQSGDYVYTTTAANGCDSIITLHLTINQTQYAEESVIACDSYAWNGETYTASGEYVYTTVAANGCDSIVTLHLTISPTLTAEETITACDSYDWNGQTYTQSGEYTYTTVAANGCDSIVTLHLTISPTLTAEETITACDSYEWNGQTYTQSGDYVYTTTAANGCDSIVTLHLTISPTLTAEETITACDSYEWNGQTYTESGDYVYTTIAANGCDSIVTLHLTINNSEIGETEYVTVCYGETYTWNGQTYSAEGEYSITLSTANGCDSIVTLHLTILPEAIIMEESASINEEHLPYLWRGQQCYDAGKYIDSEPFTNYPYCDSVIYVLNLTIEAPNKCGENLYWHYKNDTLTFTGSGAMYDDPDLLSYRNEPWYPARVSHIVLLDAITHIGNVAFADCANLTNIVIPSSVTSIGDGAFSWTGLQSVTIPASVTDLGEQVFETCDNLHTILYEGTPSSISNQTVHPFIGCVHLDTIITPAALWHCTTADPMLEARYGVPHKARYIEVTNGELTKQAMKYIAKNSGTVEVLDLSAATNTTLPLGALLNNYRLSTLYLPDQIEVIPEMLAEGCYNLLEILIPATVTEIGNYAFAGCTNVWRMTVEAVLPPKVYDKTFDGIDRSISLIVPAGSEELYRQAEYWKEFFIDDTNSQSPISNCQKILHEDHILILREGKVYTTMGQLVK